MSPIIAVQSKPGFHVDKEDQGFPRFSQLVPGIYQNSFDFP